MFTKERISMSTPFTPSNGGNMFISPGNGSDSFSRDSDLSRTLPRQLSTGSTRGTQTVGYGSVKIDGSNNRITIGNSSANSLTIGNFTNTANSTSISQGFGMSINDNSGAFITMGISDNGNNVQMIFNDSRTNRLLIGKNYQGDEVVWISSTGVDVTIADPTLPGQLIFNSNQDIFKIVRKGTASMTPLAGTDTSVIVNHNLGYIPVANVFIDTGGSYSPIPGNGLGTVIDSGASPPRTYNITWFSFVVSATQLQIICWNAGTTFGSVNFRYFLLQESIT